MRRFVRTGCLATILATWPLVAVAELPVPGTVVTKENMERYREVLHPALEYFLRNGMVIPVVEYGHVPWPPKYREATEKFSSQVVLSEDGRDLRNYVAGAPFPVIDPNDPLAAYKWMWNQEQKAPYSDNVGCGWNVELVNAEGERERFFGSNYWRRMMWRGRLYMEPKPVVPHEPAIIYTEQWGPLHDPHDLKGAGVLNFRYESPDVPDDTYMYLPELRKVRRISVANRSESFWGTDIDIDAIWTWNSKIAYWTFRLLGERKILTAYHAGGYGQREAWCAEPDGTSGMLSHIFCVPHELRDTVIVEGTPTGFTQYGYSKRVLYIDKETFMAQYNEGYDHGGELWKSWYMMTDTGTRPHGIERVNGSLSDVRIVPTKTIDPPTSAFPRVAPTHGGMVDHQLNHVSKWDCPDAYLYPEIGIKHSYADEPREWNVPETYSVNFLIKSGGF